MVDILHGARPAGGSSSDYVPVPRKQSSAVTRSIDPWVHEDDDVPRDGKEAGRWAAERMLQEISTLFMSCITVYLSVNNATCRRNPSSRHPPFQDPSVEAMGSEDASRRDHCL